MNSEIIIEDFTLEKDSENGTYKVFAIDSTGKKIPVKFIQEININTKLIDIDRLLRIVKLTLIKDYK